MNDDGTIIKVEHSLALGTRDKNQIMISHIIFINFSSCCASQFRQE